MAVMRKTIGGKKVSLKVTKRDELIDELAVLLSESYEQDVRYTKEGIILQFENEKGETKDYVFRIVEKKDRVKSEDLLEQGKVVKNGNSS